MANVRNKPTLSTEHSRPQPRILSSDSTFTCPLCSTILTSKKHLLRHVGSEHAGSLFAVCKTCMQCFAPKDIDGHMNACKGPYVCPYCHHTFALLTYLNRHIRRKHSTDDENRAPSSNTGVGNGSRYVCKLCSSEFSSINALNIHIRKHLNLACSSCGSKIIRESGDSIICGTCGNRLSSKGFEVKEAQTWDKKGSNVSVSSEAPDVASKTPQFACPYCHRLYVLLTCFRKHLATHAPSQPVISSSSANVTISNASVVKKSSRGVTEGSSTSSLVSGDAFFKDFTEEDWMQADSYLCLSQPQNLNLLHSIVYEGANLEFL